MIGTWKNVEEIEENLCLAEIEAIMKAARDKEFEQRKFAAALKGIELPEAAEESDASFEDIERRARARLLGKSEESVQLEEIGFAYIEE